MKQFRRSAVLLIFVAALLPAVVGSPVSGQPQPVLHWTFDQDTGEAVDSGSGEPANGLLREDATTTSDTPGDFSPLALDLTAPGLESWVMGPDAEKVDTLASFTLTTWLNLKGWNDGGSNNQRLLAKQEGSAAFNGFSWNVNPPGAGESGPDNFRMGLFIGGQGFDDSPAFNFGFSTEDIGAEDTWTFLAVTYDGETEDPIENVKFYLGDESEPATQLGAALDFSTAGPVASTAGLATINVGNTDAVEEVDFSVNGFQDDVRIYDTVLTEAELDEVRLANLMPSVEGDLDGDGQIGPGDLDVLAQYQKDGNLAGDLNDDGSVNSADREFWIRTMQNSWIGDSNFDGEFNSTDFVTVFTVGKYETGEMAGYAEGDWNGDMTFDSSDFVAAFADGGFEQGPRAATAAVPEPNACWLLGVGLVFCFARRPSLGISKLAEQT